MQLGGVQATPTPWSSLASAELGPRLVHLLGVALAGSIASLAAWGRADFWNASEPTHYPVLLGLFSHFGISLVTPKLSRYPSARPLSSILLAALITGSLTLVIFASLRLYYSRAFLLTFFALSIATHWVASMVRNSGKGMIGIVPGGISSALAAVPNNRWVLLRTPVPPTSLDGVLVDLHAEIDGRWKKFLASCALNSVPIFHSAVALEMATGRISLDHHSLEDLTITPHRPIYEALKPILDRILVLLTAPLWVPLGIAVAVAIKLDSPGPILFIQERVGFRGRPFRMLKFRSMHVDSEKNGPQFAKKHDARVTRVGRIIRQYRLDEIPQMINILRGEMSLIGPRPEQRKFVDEFTTQIPYYSLRHLVRPGITGWAQVTQGYAADAESTRVKLEHDLFYIKHLSPWLDLLIIWKTIQTVLSGFGAR